MTYSIIQPPFTLQFREMSKPDLRAYYSWFMNILPARIAELEQLVNSALPDWCADFSPDSLSSLGEWFTSEVGVRPRSAEELAELASSVPFPIKGSQDQLTNRTFSLAMDIGMYFGRTITKNVAGTRWQQPLANKKFADYGQPVIMGVGTVPLNPVRIVLSTAYGIAAKTRGGGRLRELYDLWSREAAQG